MSIVQVIRRIEEMGFRLYLRGEEIRIKGKPPVPDEVKTLLRQVANRQEEARAVLELWGEPCTPEQEQRVKKAFTRPGTFIVYDERTGEMRWIC
ncbi:MAG: hypothetical protein AB1374_07610 [Bacillota bacterium]